MFLLALDVHIAPYFLRAGCPSCRPTNSVKALKATSAFGLERRCYSSPQWSYLGTGSLDGVAPSRMVNVSASVNLPLHHKVQKFSSGTGSPGWSRKKGHKTVVMVVVLDVHNHL